MKVFTVTEILVVISIIEIFSLISIPAFRKFNLNLDEETL